ncbi:translation initiation factor IF-3 [Candidatus Parcubacteria bacterium]|nr:translation initiation factor IF-3 [Patescibacteria group bacterium]MBU4481840.1 translation initiation factor IF-3 [Patescibacteria group bacterium]MCG2686510.1 translation initiation factor IF-3 [Candidatus Parcubacteria bacterium]
MQIRRRRPFQKREDLKKRTRANEYIRVPEIRLINEQGENVGVIKTADALAQAKELELDLVEVNPKAKPPICKIIDYGKIKYEKEKFEHKQKVANKKTEVKGVRLSFKIKGNDLQTRVKQAQKFLKTGNSVKIEMILKGREKAHSSNAQEIINNFIKEFNEEVKVMQPTKRQGGKFFAIISPII